MRAALAAAPKILWSSAKRLYVGHGAEWAAALAYYSLLSVFPAALLAVSLAAFFVDESWAVEQIVIAVGRLLPAVSGTLASDVRDAVEHRGRVGVVALVVLVWTGSRVFSTLTRALDQALDRAHRTEHVAISLGREVLLLGATGVTLFLGTVAGLGLDIATHRTGTPTMVAVVLTALLRIALFGAAIVLLYQLVPSPRPPKRAAAAGALVATLLLVLAMPLFSTYVSRLGQYNLIYGPLAIVIVVLVWFWVASVVVLFGAHITASLEAHVQGKADPPPSEGMQAP